MVAWKAVDKNLGGREAIMKALYFERHGGTDELHHGELPRPEVGPGQVLVEIEAAALNHLDLWVLGGLPGLKTEFPHVPGADGTGTIRELGAGVDRVKPGDRVVLDPGISCGSCEFCRKGENSLCGDFHLLGEHFNGTFAQYATVPVENIHPVPPHLGFEEAAAFPLVFCTAWRMLFPRGRLQPGETVLIHGIGGGVSTAALQLVVAAGAEAVVTSHSSSKLEKAAQLGASCLIDYSKRNVVSEVKAFTKGRGVDLVVESVGEATWESSLTSLRQGGRLVTCGATTGPIGRTSIPLLFWKQFEIIGSTMAGRGDFQDMLRFVTKAGLRPVLDKSFSLQEAGQAYGRMREAEQFGKIVLKIS